MMRLLSIVMSLEILIDYQPVQCENDAFALDGDVPGDLDDALHLVMPAVQCHANLNQLK